MNDELTCYDKTTCRFSDEVIELRAALKHSQALIQRLDRSLRRIVSNGWIDEAPSSIYDEAQEALMEARREIFIR